jgi:FkbM family methyltransferase
MMRQIKRSLHKLLARTLLRQGTVRQVPIGPYRGLRFYLSEPMMSRLGAFYRAYEPEVSEWLAEFVQPGMTVCIIGGHIGIHVLYVARLLQEQGRVVVFEGWPENYAALQRNIGLNEQLNVEILLEPQCIAAAPGTIQMAQGASDGKHHIAAGGEAQTLAVPATTLDAFFGTAAVCPDMILIDIEGFELDALKGGENLLAKCRPVLVLEHHGADAALTGWLSVRSYRVDMLGRRHLVARP